MPDYLDDSITEDEYRRMIDDGLIPAEMFEWTVD